MIIKLSKFFLIFFVGINAFLAAEGKNETEGELVIKAERLKREISLLEDRALSLQFKRRMAEEAKNIYERIDRLQLEVNEIDDKIEQIRASYKEK